MEMLQALLIHNQQPESCRGFFGSGVRAGESYADISDFSSCDDCTTSDDSTMFANEAMSFGYTDNSRYTEVPNSRTRSYREHFEVSTFSPPA